MAIKYQLSTCPFQEVTNDVNLRKPDKTRRKENKYSIIVRQYATFPMQEAAGKNKNKTKQKLGNIIEGLKFN